MPRKRTRPIADHVEAQAQSDGPVEAADVFDEVIAAAQHAASDCPDPTPAPEAPPRDTPSPDTPARNGQHRRRLRHTITESVGDDRIHAVDTGFDVGIELDLGKDEKPSDAVRQILKQDGEHGRKGLMYKPSHGAKPWLKRLSQNTVGDRLDNEERFAAVVEQHRLDKGMER